MYELANFTIGDMARCCSALRTVGSDATTMEGASEAIVRHLYDGMTSHGERACALVRLYKTHALGELGEAEQKFATQLMTGEQLGPETRCLTLMATVGDNPAWNRRATSAGHQAIPLPEEDCAQL